MKAIKSVRLHGGIRPPPFKTRSLRSVIMATPVPEHLIIPLIQYGGQIAAPAVAVGDKVLKGQALTRIDLEGICPIHAPTSGTIEAIEPLPVADEFTTYQPCVVLRSDGEDCWTALDALPDWDTSPPEDLISRIHRAGVIGLGGAGFPLAKKLHSLQGRKLETLIINAVECEPYISCDQALVRARTADLVSGIQILRYITGATRTVIAIGNNKTDAIDALRQHLPRTEIRLVTVPPDYPAGSEKQLIQRIVRRQLPRDALPADIGALVVNAGTAYAVFRAIVLGQPLVSRITTLCGETLATPKNFEALIGTPVFFLLELCGVDYQRLSHLLCGGSIMGHTVTDLNVPLDKTTNCLIAGSEQEFPTLPEPMECIRCGYCASACPVSLQPQLLYRHIRAGALEQAEQSGVQDCIECGACNWVCPSHIPLLQYYRYAKYELESLAARRLQSQQWQQRFELHQYRMARKHKSKPQQKPDDRIAGADAAIPQFDRNQARIEIAAAVERARARRENLIASSAQAINSHEPLTAVRKTKIENPHQ
ncbi:MAG: electron transport complex subunit RsxC [Pseudohongiellaceae bacterium]